MNGVTDEQPQETDTSRSTVGEKSPGYWMAGAATASAAALAVAVYAGPVVLAAAYLLVSALVVVGWPILLGLQRQRSSMVVLGLGALSLTAIVGWSDSADGIRWVTAALAISLALVFLQSLIGRGGRENVVIALAGMALGLGVLASGAFVADAALRPNGREAVVAAMVAAAAGAVLDSLLLRRSTLREWALPVTLMIGIGSGVLAARIAQVPWNAPLVAGLLAAGVSHALRTILSGLPGRARSVPAALALGAAGVLFVAVLPTAAVWFFAHLN